VIALDVVTEAGDWPAEAEAAAREAAAAAIAVSEEGDDPLAATLLLADDAAIRVLNRDWRGKDTPTNVLSFPSDMPTPPGEPRHLGDVALAFETVAREAAEEGKSVPDHVAHLVVHGILHLLGADHETDGEADAMEAREIEALARIGIADPYGRAAPQP
jgi:probable rRNA maturation factor